MMMLILCFWGTRKKGFVRQKKEGKGRSRISEDWNNKISSNCNQAGREYFGIKFAKFRILGNQLPKCDSDGRSG